MASVEARVAHVWRRLGFGPTPGDVQAGVAAGGPAAVIEDLLARPAAPQANWPGGTGFNAGLAMATRLFELMSTNAAQVQERVAWLLQGLLVVGATDFVGVPQLVTHTNNLRNWPNRSYRALLEDVVRSDSMQWYLSGVFSQPPHPNENLGRELVELFSLGVTDARTGETNYTETDVKEMARALTGFWFNFNTKRYSWQASHWDPDDKTFLGADRGAAGVPAVLDAIAEHPSFSSHVPLRVYRELVGLEPSANTLDSLARVWGDTGDIAGLVAAIAHRPEFTSDAALRARVKSPVELVVSAIRALGLQDLGRFNLGGVTGQMGQMPWYPPNVSGWGSGKAWLHAGTVLIWAQISQLMALSDNGQPYVAAVRRVPTVRRLFADGSNQTGGDLALNLVGLHDVSPQTLQAVRDYAAAGTWTHWRAAGTVLLALQSPEFYVS